MENDPKEIDYEQEVSEFLKDEKFVRLPRNFIKKFGLTISMYLYTLIEWKAFLKIKFDHPPDTPFFMTREKIRERSFLSDEQQELSLKKIVDFGIIRVERGGFRNRNNYIIDFKTLYKILLEPIGNVKKEDFSDHTTWSLKNDSVTIPHGHSISETVLRSKDSETEDVSNETSVGPNGPTNSTPRLSLRKSKGPVEFGGHLPERIDVVEIFSYWNTSPGLSHHKTPKRNEAPTKSLISIYKAIGDVLDGTFLKDWPPYPSDQIIKAIEGFKTRRTNPDYSPTNKDTLKSIDLTTFFWNPYSSQMPSMFLECLNNPPKLLKNTVPKEVEKNPQLTKWLQKMYIDKVLLKQPKVFNQVEINKFIKGANLLQDSIANLRKRANLMTGPYEFCEYTINALLANFRREDIKPGNISSDWTYNELLPRYLKEVGRID
jgi:hypothetical protein